jgi:hypothetical protein
LNKVIPFQFSQKGDDSVKAARLSTMLFQGSVECPLKKTFNAFIKINKIKSYIISGKIVYKLHAL